jgi:hypothetical protein
VAFYGPQKGLVMLSRIRDRLKRLEGQIMPPSARLPCSSKPRSQASRPNEQLAAFKAEKGVGPHDTLVTVTFTFA